ncbi:hypothetical protein PR001_g15883 [Phytophthora rubi]|uniref:Uncharacterized protein n=1 Tax=Phytophthora rubi TaxID=129364 RepID=A0A6A3KXI8_9STRA|nr:hypothetical protein PR001_g15883 [Phytophthora rubi]
MNCFASCSLCCNALVCHSCNSVRIPPAFSKCLKGVYYNTLSRANVFLQEIHEAVDDYSHFEKSKAIFSRREQNFCAACD